MADQENRPNAPQPLEVLDGMSCPRCGIGHLHARRVNFVSMWDDTLLARGNVPALECDVCSLRHYDEAMMQKIDTLMEAEQPEEEVITPFSLFGNMPLPPMGKRPVTPRKPKRSR